MTVQTSFWLVILLFILCFPSGIWLSKKGRPLNTIIFTIHKLVAAALTVCSVLFICNLTNLDTNTSGFYLIYLSFILLAFSVISGALLSFDRLVSNKITFIHKIARYSS